ncbi:MAG: acetate kinase [Calditrichaeota bacterium]|jgi:acetate kinase|nr:acetate kinase [Calditrichota bacterium]MBT7618388.1 acetate kinase [Calditrichota bacterium]MBT7787856.1 acetate kinase [Calditrichota bacterium]
MNILVLNSGSSSAKYRFYEMETEKCLCWGLVERIGSRGALMSHNRHDGNNLKKAIEIPDHAGAIESIIEVLLSPEHGVIEDKNNIDAIGHRVVHGGEKFSGSVLIDDEVMKQLYECIELAPLHNPHNIKGIMACREMLNDKPQVAVFDTAFHQGIPDYAYLYALPYSLYKKYGLRRYGFHGTSHRYVADRAAAMMDNPVENLKLITCHLGNGCSIAAVKNGVSIDTSMGFTPVEGLIMGTRCGDIDPAALLYIMSREDLGNSEANSLINKHSGLYGISGLSNDMREIESEALAGNSRAEVALDMFCYRIRKYIGAYAFAMGGVDGIVFTGGIGENSYEVRTRTLNELKLLNIELDPEKNKNRDTSERFIDFGRGVRTMVIPTNEELVIARDSIELIQG